MKEIAEMCSHLIVTCKTDQLSEYIANLPRHIRLNKIVDDEGYTLLHMAAFQDRTKIFKSLIAKAKEDLRPEEII